MTLRELNLSSSYKCRHILCQVSETGNYFYSRHFKNIVDRLERLNHLTSARQKAKIYLNGLGHLKT